MVTKKFEETTFYQCLRISWAFAAMIGLIILAKVFGFIEPYMIALLVIPLGLIAMCFSLFAVTQSGEAVEVERRTGTHH